MYLSNSGWLKAFKNIRLLYCLNKYCLNDLIQFFNKYIHKSLFFRYHWFNQILEKSQNTHTPSPRITWFPLAQLPLTLNFGLRTCKFIGNWIRGVSGGWAGWAIAHPDFGRIEGAAGQLCGGAPHHYLPLQIFRPCAIPAIFLNLFDNQFYL